MSAYRKNPSIVHRMEGDMAIRKNGVVQVDCALDGRAGPSDSINPTGSLHANISRSDSMQGTNNEAFIMRNMWRKHVTLDGRHIDSSHE